MGKQVLTVEQMQHLRDLGLELEPTMLSYVHSKLLEDEKWDLTTLKDLPRGMFEQIPAYTLQDILDILPKFICVGDERECYLDFGISNGNNWVAYYDLDMRDVLYYYSDIEFIDAAYEILCCVIEDECVKTE